VSEARRVALVFAGAPVRSTPRLRARLSSLGQPYVVAGDGGAATSLALGFRPDLIVGDLDSLDEATRTDVQRRGVPIQRHSTDKDATDGQLALEAAVRIDPEQLVLVGFLGGLRLDQTIANVLLLAAARVSAVLLDEFNECRLLRGPDQATWSAEATELISLLPLGGDAEGVRTQGLRWPLRGDRLELGHTRGISNQPLQTKVSVAVEHGLLLVSRHFPTQA
jgi:thiamine pyrophosphokinase